MAEATKVAGQILFQNSLAEVVRKLRSTTKSEAEVIEQSIADTKKEITSTVQSVKVTAMMKAAYFSMLGYSAAYGAFNIIEVMADKTFVNKRLGYMAACLTFTPKTDVLPLLTALLKRDLASANQYEIGLALYCISSICTTDLARDLVADVVNLLNHPRNYVRKKAVLSLYRIFFEYPDSLRPTYPRLKEKLESSSERCDNDPAVRGAVVCVLCELARRNPSNFLGLAVPFFSMLTSVHSNWTLIKIVKVFGYFAPLEPRLGKKLVEPITNLIHSTTAKSVQYECVLAVANGMSRVASLTKLAAEKIKLFVNEADQNLKYLGLDAMSRLLEENAKLLSDQRSEILACLDDPDSTIRRKALGILRRLVTRKNFVSTVDSMMEHCVRTPPDEDWSNRVILTVMETAQTDDYALVQDFEWYLGILLDMSLVNLSTFQYGGMIERELVTVLTRVNAVRPFGVAALNDLLSNVTLLNCDAKVSTQWEVLKAAAFLCGEYPYWLTDKRTTCERLLSDRVALLHPEAQVAFVASVGKIAAFVQHPSARQLKLTNGEEESTPPHDPVTLEELLDVLLPQPEDTETTGVTQTKGIIDSHAKKTQAQHSSTTDEWNGDHRPRGLHVFRHSVHPDVQERANLIYYHLVIDPTLATVLYAAELRPVAAGAQEAVAVPDGLDLDAPFCANIPALLQLSDSEEENEADGDDDPFHIGLGAVAARRREEVAAFYINEGTLAGREEPPNEVQLETVTAASLQLHSAKAGPPHAPRKTQTMNRDLSRPTHAAASNASCSAPPRRRSAEDGEEEDEATRKFRHVDVTRALAAGERLPEAIPYAQLLQMRSGAQTTAATGIGGGAFADSNGAEEGFEPIVLLEERHLRVTVRVLHCRARRSGLSLRLTVEVMNLASSSSAYEVTLQLTPNRDTYAHPTLRLTEETATAGRDEKLDAAHTHKSKTKAAAEHEKSASQTALTEETRVRISDRIKGTTAASREVTLVFAFPLPESLSAPLPLCLTYVREKKPVTAPLPLPLTFAYIAKSAKEISSMEFNDTILRKHLASAHVLSSFVPMEHSKVSFALPLFLSRLRLRAMDVYKDAASFYGVLHTRKSSADAAHVAALLYEDKEDEVTGISIAVKAHEACVAEILIQATASLLLELAV